MADRKVKTSVKVGGTWYYAGTTMPAEVADTVTNPKVFEAEPEQAAEPTPVVVKEPHAAHTPKPAKKAAPKKA